MGFLIGAYGKLMAGKRLRSLQFRLTQVMSRIQRITRQAADVERMMSSQQQAMQRNMRMQSIFMQQGLTSGIQSQIFGDALYSKIMSDPSSLTKEEQKQYQEGMYLANMQQQQQMQGIQMMQMQQQQQMQEYFESMREAQLEPLKDLEDSLQTEKGSLESQIALAEQDYKSMKEMEKAGAKDYVPEYTGQG